MRTRLIIFALGGLALSNAALAQEKQTDTTDIPLFQEGIILDEGTLPPLIEVPDFPSDNFENDESLAAAAYAKGDYIEARTLAATAAANGNARAQYLLATLLRKGLGQAPEAPVEVANAIKWYREAANNGEMNANLALAEMSFANAGGLIVSDGRSFLLKAANQGSVEAKIVLGQVFATGLGGPLDIEQAISWYQSAVQDGSVLAKQYIGNLYYSQHKDAEALTFYKAAAREGDARSAYQAGIIMADPQSKFYDLEAAAPLLHKSALAGEPAGMTAWGIFSVQQNPSRPAEAARWFRKAAEADDGEGQYLYSIILAKGEGVKEDREAAYEWAVRAVRHDPNDQDRRALAVSLGSALPGPVRGRIEEVAEQPLFIFGNTTSP